jgi:class 3 adenylate cyclase/predicted ATPase
MSQCPACGAGVSPQARFCPECGKPLSGRCAKCGADLPAGARFCMHCGTAAEPGAIEGERRQLSVAFCDLVGSTELSARLDPEEFSDLIHGYQRRAVEAAGRYGGTVEKYLGEGILFCFGWPEAHDDDPECAVRAGLEIVEELGRLGEDASAQPLAARVGVHTGPVVIGERGGEDSRETMALGETLNFAARLQGIAQPGTVIVSGATLDLVPGIFVTEDLGPQQLKGLAEQVRAYRVVQASGIRSQFDVARETLTEFVNREVEFSMLVKRWEQTRTRGGQAVLVLGEPGVGKSRLVYQLRQRLGGTQHSWLECGCSSYTAQSTFRPAIDLIEQGLQMERGEPPSERLEKLRRGLGAAGVDSPDSVPLLATVLAIPVTEGLAPLTMSPDRRRKRTIEVLVEWVLGLARLQPMVLLAEDLHWCDPSSLELFGELIAQGRGASLLLIGSARSEFEAPWGARPNLTVLSLSPFPEPELRQIVSTVGGERDLPAELVERIVAESGGIPLYAEEIGRMVLGSGAVAEGSGGLELTAPMAELDIPTTLQGSLMARLDQLSSAKHVAQLAAVIGREFGYELLEEVADVGAAALREGLDRLVESELLFQQGNPPRAAYTFKHALIQDAAYQSLLKRTRRRLHERIADALERQLGEDPLALPEVVARHYEAAERPDAAVANYHRAADEAARHSGFREAIAHLHRAIELLAQLPDSDERDRREVEMQLALGSAIIATSSYADPAIEEAYDRALQLCERLGDDKQVAEALAGLSIFYLNRGNLERGGELAERVLEVGQLDDDDELRLLGHIQSALPHILRAEFEIALAHAERAHALYDPERHRSIAFRFGTDHGVVAHCFAGWSLNGLGFIDQALVRMRRGVELAREVAHPFSLAYALLFEAQCHWIREDWARLAATAESLTALSEEQGFDLWTGLGHVYLGLARATRTGDPAGLHEVLEGSLVAGREGNLAGSTAILGAVAQAQRAVGDPDGALGTIEAALAVSAETGQPWWDADLYRLKGELLLGAGNGESASADEGGAELQRAIQTAREQRFLIHELRAATSFARLLAERGEIERAASLLLEPYARLTEGLATTPVADARALLEELGVEPPQPAPAEPPAALGQAGGKPSSG